MKILIKPALFVHDTRNILQKTFSPALLLLWIVGVPALLPRNKVRQFIYKCTKYIYLLIAAIDVVIYTYLLSNHFNRRTIVLVLILINRITLYILIRHLCNRILSTFDLLSKIFEKIPLRNELSKIKSSLCRYCIGFFIINLLRVVAFPFDFEQKFQQFPKWVQWYRHISRICFFIYSTTLIYSFSFFYWALCDFITLCSNYLNKALQKPVIKGIYLQLIHLYDDISLGIQSLDDTFSLPILLVVFNCVLSSFWAGFDFAFKSSMKSSFIVHYIAVIITNFTVVVKIVWSASLATESVSRALESLMSLPGRIPEQSMELMALLSKYSKQNKKLTLWKMYDLKRSLIFTIFGTLLTYGILLGTLGNVQGEQ